MTSSKDGFTLLEVLVSITLIAILLAIGYGSYERFKQRAKKAVCISHLNTFHTALSSAITDNGEWPQIPIDDGSDWTEDKFYEWWFLEMEKYGISEENWLCPSDKVRLEQRAQANKNQRKKMYLGSYVPARIESGSASPFRYSIPWMAEKGSYHRGGGHLLMPDGSITTKMNPFAGR